MCDQRDDDKQIFPQIDLSRVPDEFRELQFCKICSYVYRECENMGQLNCRFHPRDPVIGEDAHGDISLRYPCCGILARAYGKERVADYVYSDGCTMCDHLPFEGCTLSNTTSELRIQFPHDMNTSFFTDTSRETYKKIYDIDMLEVFPADMTRRFSIPAPHPYLVVASFDSIDAFNAWLAQPTSAVETYIGGLTGRSIREPRERISTNSLGVRYLRAMTTQSRQATETELSADELRRANLLAVYHNTWKESVPQTESSALLYHRPADFFRVTRPVNVDGEIVVYQRGHPRKKVLHQRRGKPTGIVI